MPEAGLWLDAHRGKDLSFVSHAHSDHVAGHRRMVCSQPTAWLLKERFGYKGEMITPAWDEPWEHQGHVIRLTPAGHILGSAMIHVTRIRDGATLLYTGDFKLRPGLTAEPARPLPADTLIMECTFGLPHYRFPPRDQIRQALHRWCRNALDHGETPVLLGYSLGKAQEIQALLAGDHFRIAVHPQVAAMNAAYEVLGVTLPPWETFAGEASGRVLVFPPQTLKSTLLKNVANKVSAVVSGWAIHAGTRFSWQTDEAFPLSDHADYDELLELVERVHPATILTTHGNSAGFAQDLRRRGWNAWSLTGNDQLELKLDLPVQPPARTGTGPHQPVVEPADGTFQHFCRVAEEAARTAGRLAQAALLAEYFRTLAGSARLAAAVRFFAGKPAATRDPLKAMGTGWALIRLALLQATGVTAARCREISRSGADTGRIAYQVLEEGRSRNPQPWLLEEIQSLFDRLRLAPGPSAKAALLTEAFRRLSALEGQYLVRILTGDSRPRLKEGLLEEAIGEAFDQPLDVIRQACMLSGDAGETAVRAKEGTAGQMEMRPFQPVPGMLASLEETPAALWERLAGMPRPEDPGKMKPVRPGPDCAPRVWLEDRYEGIRAQLHVAGGRAGLFSRDLLEMSAGFPGLLRQARAFRQDVILDGVIIGAAAGGQPGFSGRRKRPGRREADWFLPEEDPARFMAFDLLWLDGRTLLKEPLRVRRHLLEALTLPDGFECTRVRAAGSVQAIAAALQEAISLGHQGLVAKDPDSPYEAGRRGQSWLELAP